MRDTIRKQMALVEPSITHEHSIEMRLIQKLLDNCPAVMDLVHQDLVAGLVDPEAGRKGMSAEQVFKGMLIKQMNGFSYEKLAFHLEDSRTYRAFCGFGFADNVPSDKTLQRDIKKVRPETLEVINQLLMKYAETLNIENGERVRIDCTVVESHIHHPTDSSLLDDCVRVLCRWTGRAKVLYGVKATNRHRRARKLALEIMNAKNAEARLGPYKKLLKTTKSVLREAHKAIIELAIMPNDGTNEAMEICKTLQHYSALTENVISQTERRVIDGKKVPVEQKIVSIFEEHTDIIRKDRRDTYYGHKIALSNGASGLITDLVISRGNPADSNLAVDMVKRQDDVFGRVPIQVSFDGAFAARENLENIKALGTEHVVFAKKCGIKIAEMTKSMWIYKQLRNFRAGIEGMISFLKRCFGFSRCTWRGFKSFKAYAWASVISINLLLMARRLMT